MAKGQVVILRGDTHRALAKRLIDAAPSDAVVEVAAPRRSTDQNALLWALLSDVSRAKPDGRTLTPDVWKGLFMHALDHSIRFEPALDGMGMVPMGFRSSRMTKAQMGDLIEFITAWGSERGVAWTGPEREAA